MLGTYDFCGYYEWTFAWLERAGGAAALTAYWEHAISRDSQRHARHLLIPHGIEGMKCDWRQGATSPRQSMACCAFSYWNNALR